jgi:hypothetical protein
MHHDAWLSTPIGKESESKRRGGDWELLYATNLAEGDTFGRSNPKYVSVDSYWELDCFAQRKRVVFRKEWYPGTGKEVMGWKGIPCCTACWALY